MISEIFITLLIGIISVFVIIELYRFLNSFLSSPRMYFEILKANPFGSVIFPLVLIIIWFFIFG